MLRQKEGRCMSLPFLRSSTTGLPPNAGGDRVTPGAAALRAAGACLLVSLAAFFAACSSTASEAAITNKVYIEPPKQQKIAASTTALRVCADPNNLPFSNEKQEGFENKIASLLGHEMNLPVEYTWWAERRG